MRYRADDVGYELVTVFGREAIFSCDRIERDSVPKGLYQYEVRHDDCCQGIRKRQILRSLPNYAPLFIGGAYCNIQLEVLSTMA